MIIDGGIQENKATDWAGFRPVATSALTQRKKLRILDND